MQHKDYYKILGIDRRATREQIRSAYRKLARKYHPDISRETNAEEFFKEIGEAYEILKDPHKRAQYDRLEHSRKTGYNFQTHPAWKAVFNFPGARFTNRLKSGFKRALDSLWTRKWASKPNQPGDRWFGGKDHSAKVQIDLVDTYLGANRRITLQIPEQTRDGTIRTGERVLEIRIPKGIKNGQRIRLKGQGLRGNFGSRAGDLYLEIEFKPHPFFNVKDSDLYLDLPIAPWEAALGATIQIPTPVVPVEIKIPPGSRQGDRIRLKELGIPGSPSGDFYVTLEIVIPPAETEQEKNVYRDMARRLPFDPRSAFSSLK